jgi:hypothetical protein
MYSWQESHCVMADEAIFSGDEFYLRKGVCAYVCVCVCVGGVGVGGVCVLLCVCVCVVVPTASDCF